MPLARAGMAIFGLGALTVGAAALTDGVLHGHLMVLSPLVLGALALLGVAVSARRPGRCSASRTHLAEQHVRAALACGKTRGVACDRFRDQRPAPRKRSSLQGPCRCAGRCDFPAFARQPAQLCERCVFQVVWFDPAERHRPSIRARIASGQSCTSVRSFAGLETGKARVRYDQYVRTAYGWRWIAWEDYAIRDASGHLIEIQSVGPRRYRAKSA